MSHVKFHESFVDNEQVCWKLLPPPHDGPDVMQELVTTALVGIIFVSKVSQITISTLNVSVDMVFFLRCIFNLCLKRYISWFLKRPFAINPPGFEKWSNGTDEARLGRALEKGFALKMISFNTTLSTYWI